MISDRWLKVGTIFGIIACVVFAAACGGGGGGGGGGSTTVAMALSFPSGAAKPGTSDGGAVGKTMISLATVIVINTAGTEYTLTEPDSANNPGVYSGSVTGLSEGDSLIIKARKGELELSKLIPNVIMLGAATTTYDAGEVDTTSTSFTEIVKEIADNLAVDLSLTGVDMTDGTDDLSELIQNLSSITAEIDLVQLYTEVTNDAIGVDYSAMRTAVDTACQAAVTSGAITSLSVLEEGSSAASALDRTVTFLALATDVLTDYPDASTDGAAVLVAGQALLNAFLAADATAAALVMDDTTTPFLWSGGTRAETLADWATDWADDVTDGITSRTFTGVFLSDEVTAGSRWKVGLKGVMEWKNSNGTIVDWEYWDAFKSDEHWFYIDKIGGSWLAVGNQQKQLIETTFSYGKFWDTGDAVPGSPSSTWWDIDADVEQILTSTSANLISSITVTGTGTAFNPVTTLTQYSDATWTEWWASEINLAADPSGTDLGPYTFNITYGNASTATPTSSLPPFTPSVNLSAFTLSTFTESASSIDFAWVAPTLDAEIAELAIGLEDSSDTELYYEYVIPTITSASISTSGLGLVTGNTYEVTIEYIDIYFNEYSLNKGFIMP